MKIIVILVCAGLSFSSFAQPRVVMVSEYGFIVENQIETPAEPQEVWQALIHDVDLWWPKDHSWWGADGTFSIAAEPGGCFCETAENRFAEHMHISFAEPGKLLRMTGGLGPLQGMGMHGALDWVFEDIDTGTRVTLTYKVNGISPDGFEKLAPIVAAVQGQQLGGLKAHVEQNP